MEVTDDISTERRLFCRTENPLEESMLRLVCSGFVSQSEVMIFGDAESRGSTGTILLILYASRLTLNRWRAISAEYLPMEPPSVEEEVRAKSSAVLVPPRLSISFRTLVIHSSISSALSRTNSKLVASLRVVMFCDRKRVSSEFLGLASTAPWPLAWLET